MKKLIYFILTMIIFVPFAKAETNYINEAEIDLDSINYNRDENTSEIRMKIYNNDKNSASKDMYYAMYYLKMDCSLKMYKPIIIEGYNKNNELLLVDYNKKALKEIVPGSNMEQAYNYACQITAIPDIPKK